MPLVEGFGCLELVLYGIRKLVHHDLNQSKHSVWMDLDQWEVFTLPGAGLHRPGRCRRSCTWQPGVSACLPWRGEGRGGSWPWSPPPPSLPSHTSPHTAPRLWNSTASLVSRSGLSWRWEGRPRCPGLSPSACPAPWWSESWPGRSPSSSAPPCPSSPDPAGRCGGRRRGPACPPPGPPPGSSAGPGTWPGWRGSGGWWPGPGGAQTPPGCQQADLPGQTDPVRLLQAGLTPGHSHSSPARISLTNQLLSLYSAVSTLSAGQLSYPAFLSIHSDQVGTRKLYSEQTKMREAE